MIKSIKKFNELNNKQLYNILKLRYQVFVVEQNSIYNEYDDIDFSALHIFYEENNEILVYCRIYQKNNKTASVGRIVISPKRRNTGWGKRIIKEAIAYIKLNWSADEIVISAQHHLEAYYESFGFKKISGIYDDGGMPHIDMVLKIMQ